MCEHSYTEEENVFETMQSIDIVNVSEKVKLHMTTQLIALINDLECYYKEIPVLGFNSSKYDLKLIKSKIAKHLQLHQNQEMWKKNHLQLKLTMLTFALPKFIRHSSFSFKWN